MQTRVREWRRRRVMTQRDLAAASGVAQGTIARIEMGLHEPRPSTLRKLARALQVEPGQLLAEGTTDTKRAA